MRLTTALMGSGLALVVAASLLRYALPDAAALRPELSLEPTQTETQAAPFQTTVGGVTYTLTPRAQYEIWGLVVSQHDTRSWWNWIHEAWHDHLNVVDLCVVFAENAASGGYVGLNYSSGQFVCYVQTGSTEKWQRFSMRALSNNHLLTDSPALARKLRDIRIGDQVRVRGLLTEYAHNDGFAFKRGTSLTRDDTGNGACETIYVQDVEVLARGGGPWRVLWWLGWVVMAGGGVLWLRSPFRIR